MIAPLIVVRSTEVWHRHTDFKTCHRVTESLVLSAIGRTWTATGDRDARGRLVYRSCACRTPCPPDRAGSPGS
jgi:hypothetical protein